MAALDSAWQGHSPPEDNPEPVSLFLECKISECAYEMMWHASHHYFPRMNDFDRLPIHQTRKTPMPQLVSVSFGHPALANQNGQKNGKIPVTWIHAT